MKVKVIKVILFGIRKKQPIFLKKNFSPTNLKICQILKLAPPSNFEKFQIFFKKVRFRRCHEKTAKFEENPSGSSLNHEAQIFKKNLNFAPERGPLDSGQNFLPYPVAIRLPHNHTKFGAEMLTGSEDISERNFIGRKSTVTI